MEINKFQIIRKIAVVNVLRTIAIKYFGLVSRSPHKAYKESVFPDLDVDKELKEIKKKGYSLGISLSKEQLKEVLAFCEENETCIDRDRNDRLKISMIDDSQPVKGTVFSYTNSYKKCEAIRKIAHDPKVLAVAEQYLGCAPKFLGSQIWWSYPHLDETGNPKQTQLYGFHYDIDDLKFLKIFFYLNDVDKDRGPHVIIENTHQKKSYFEIRNRRLSDAVAQEKYGNQIAVIEGKAGEGFFEDTFCYHKGTQPNKRRLLLQFEFAINDFGHQNDNH
jgi:hypothetical protein